MNRGRAVVAPSYPVRPTFTAVLTAYLPVVSVFWAGGRPCSSERCRPENLISGITGFGQFAQIWPKYCPIYTVALPYRYFVIIPD